MKRTSQPYVVLTLIMLVIVMVAAYFFLFRSWGQVADAVDSAEATRTVLAAALATAESDTAALETQLLQSEQQITALDADLAQAQSTLAQFAAESQDETTRLLIASPQNGVEIVADQPFEVIVVAIDVAGISEISLDLNGEVRRLPVNDVPVHIARELWTPTETGAAQISATATNSNGRASNPTSVNVSVVPAPPPPQSETPAPVPVAIAAATATAADSFTVGAPIDLIIFAADPVGITEVSVTVGANDVESFVADGETVGVYRTSWVPTAAGEFTFSVTVENVDGGTTTRDTFTISVEE